MMLSFSSNKFFYNFIYFWLYFVFIATQAVLQLQRVGAALQLRYIDLSLLASLVEEYRLQGNAGFSSCGSQAQSMGSIVVAHGLGSSAACGIFPDQGSNSGPLQQRVDSLSLDHQGSPSNKFFIFSFFFFIYFYQLEANYFTILKWVLSYIDMNQPWIYMYSPS